MGTLLLLLQKHAVSPLFYFNKIKLHSRDPLPCVHALLQCRLGCTWPCATHSSPFPPPFNNDNNDDDDDDNNNNDNNDNNNNNSSNDNNNSNTQIINNK